MRASRAARPGRRVRRVLAAGAVALAALAAGVLFCTSMPGRSHRGALPELSTEDRALALELEADVTALAGRIGERNAGRQRVRLAESVAWVEQALAGAGLPVRRADFEGGTNFDVEIAGTSRPKEMVVVGAHYDSALGARGADDDASGVAAVLALARRLAGAHGARTLRLALFANEEMPYFGTGAQGSLVYARACRARGDDVVAMLSLETMGYFKDEPGTQHYPWGFGALYPDRGDFIAFVGDVGSRGLVREAVRAFREEAAFPSEGAALPDFVPGVGWSDHGSFWQAGYRAIMITDTAPFRNPHYHTPHDSPETLDYARLARVVLGVERVVRRLVGPA